MITASDAYGLVIVYLLIIVTLLLYVFLKRKDVCLDRRKMIHILIGNFVFIWWLFDSELPMLVFFTIPFMVLLFLSAPDSEVSFLRQSIIGEASQKGHSYGLFFYAVSITVLVAFFFDHFIAASIGVIAMSYGDGFGSIVGRRMGKHPIKGSKTLEGSLGVFTATFIMTLVVVSFYDFIIGQGLYYTSFTGSFPLLLMAFIAGAFTAVVELYSPGEYDNLIIPISVALLMAILGF
jgi:phytol kinase